MWEELLRLFSSGGEGASQLLQGGASAGVGLDPSANPAYAQLLGMQPDPNLGFMTMPQPMPQPQTNPLIQNVPSQQMMDNIMGPVAGKATDFQTSGDPNAAAQQGATADAMAARKPIGFTAEQAALLAKMAGGGQTEQAPRPPAVAGGGVSRPQAPGMTQLGFGGYDPRKRATLGSLIYGR